MIDKISQLPVEMPKQIPQSNAEANGFKDATTQLAYEAAYSRGAMLGSLVATLAFQEEHSRSKAAAEYRARHDPLTGLPNRLALEEAFEGLCNDQHRRGRGDEVDRPNSIAIFDIDEFKDVNDGFGHPIGDEVLVGLSEQLVTGFRQRDVVARMGGEEFVVLLPRSNEEDTFKKVNAVRESIAQTPIKLSNGSTLRITVSAGVALLDTVNDFNTSYTAADAALYDAKNAGRNQVIVASASLTNQRIRTNPAS